MTIAGRVARRQASGERNAGRLQGAAAAVAAVGLGVLMAVIVGQLAYDQPATSPPPASARPPAGATPVTTGPPGPPGGPVTTAPGPTHRDEENAGNGRQAPPGGDDDPTPAPAPPPRSAPPPSAGPGPGPDPGPPATSPDGDLVLVDVCIEPLVCLEGGLL